MKEKLLKLLKAKEDARAALVAKSEKSEDLNEVRGIHSQIEAINAEITELRGLIAEAEAAEKPDDDGEGEPDARTAAVTQPEPNQQNQEKRSFTPGVGFKPVGKSTAAGTRSKEETETADREKRGKDLKEGRAVTVGSSSIVVPQYQASTINPTFNKISSLIDRVDILILNGGESFTQPYEKDTPAGDYSAEGADYNTADVVFGYASINKSKVTAYSETTEEIEKLPAAAYETVVMNGIRKSVRRKITKEILVGDGDTNHLAGIFSAKADAINAETDISFSSITNTTLNDIIFSYGGDEEVEDQAVLILNKVDLKAFSQLRTADGKPFHTIVSSGNTGTIDGIPYVINSACNAISASGTAANAYCMAYGPLSNYKLVVFSDLDVRRSDDYKFKSGQIAHRGSVFAGGNVVTYNGFVRVKKAAAAA